MPLSSAKNFLKYHQSQLRFKRQVILMGVFLSSLQKIIGANYRKVRGGLEEGIIEVQNKTVPWNLSKNQSRNESSKSFLN